MASVAFARQGGLLVITAWEPGQIGNQSTESDETRWNAMPVPCERAIDVGGDNPVRASRGLSPKREEVRGIASAATPHALDRMGRTAARRKDMHVRERVARGLQQLRPVAQWADHVEHDPSPAMVPTNASASSSILRTRCASQSQYSTSGSERLKHALPVRRARKSDDAPFLPSVLDSLDPRVARDPTLESRLQQTLCVAMLAPGHGVLSPSLNRTRVPD